MHFVVLKKACNRVDQNGIWRLGKCIRIEGYMFVGSEEFFEGS